ncbi:MAG TPA: FAD-dependent monooxygenase [Myxococcota bacterium]
MTNTASMPRRKSVLISGASIAGPALAFWLHRAGYDVVVVERSPALRRGGQNVDVRGAGREVARRMQIEDAIRAATTGEVGVRFVDEHNQVIGEFPAGTGDSDGATAELEILRGDLAALLYERTKDDVTYRFGRQITAIAENDTGVVVSFDDGSHETFDLVVAADGVRSRTRSLIIGDAFSIKPLDFYTSYFTIDKGHDDSAWARWFNAPAGRTSTLRPDNVGTTRATLSFVSSERGLDDLDDAGVRAMLREKFGDLGWEVPRILDGVDGADDFYFEDLAQVMATTWSKGRCALTGDAAWCATPISGRGTSLALLGAYVLAGELGRHASHVDAFAAYEQVMRPFVDEAQQLPPGAPRIANPKSELGIALFNTAIRVAAGPVGTVLGKVFSGSSSEAHAVPDYDLKV